MTQETIEVQVASVRDVARDTRLIELRRPDGAALPDGEAGAHIGLHLPNGMMRQYSLVSAATAPMSYAIGVKRDAASRGGSQWVHDNLKPGVVLRIDPPRNNFPLAGHARSSILFAGGIGITPILSMVRRLKELGKVWTLHYACRSRADAAFIDELKVLGDVRFHFDDEAGGFFDVAAALKDVPRDAHLYCCGPAPMLDAFERAAAEWPRVLVHVEYFTAREAAATSGGFTVECRKSGKSFIIPPGRKILHVLREGGVTISSSCEEGICGACETDVLEGIPDHRDAILSKEERAANKTMFVCCSGSKTDTLVLDV